MLGDPSYYAYRDDNLLILTRQYRSWGPFYHRSDLVRLTVTMRPRGETQLVVRASAQYYLMRSKIPGPTRNSFAPSNRRSSCKRMRFSSLCVRISSLYLAPTNGLNVKSQETAASHLGGVHKRFKTLGAHRLAPVHKLDMPYSARRAPHYPSRRGPSRDTVSGLLLVRLALSLRDGEVKTAAFPRCTFHPDSALMEFDEMFGNSQSKSRAPRLSFG